MQKQEKAVVTISTGACKTLLLDAYKRQRIEACGLLLGSIDESGNWHVEEAHPLRNIFDSPVYFEFAPEDLLAADLAQPGRIIGVYHSHPTGLTVASFTDRKNMKRVNVDEQIAWVWLIISGPFDCPPALLPHGQRHLRTIQGPSIAAYHHYRGKGLRRVVVRCEESLEVTSSGDEI